MDSNIRAAIKLARRFKNRSAAGGSYVLRYLAKTAPALEKELTAKVQKYTGESKLSKARVISKDDRLEITVWLELGPEGTADEARELATILLGESAKVGPHVLNPTMWVAASWVESTAR